MVLWINSLLAELYDIVLYYVSLYNISLYYLSICNISLFYISLYLNIIFTLISAADRAISDSEAQRRIDSQFSPNRCTEWFCLDDVADSARDNIKQYEQQKQ